MSKGVRSPGESEEARATRRDVTRRNLTRKYFRRLCFARLMRKDRLDFSLSRWRAPRASSPFCRDINNARLIVRGPLAVGALLVLRRARTGSLRAFRHFDSRCTRERTFSIFVCCYSRNARALPSRVRNARRVARERAAVSRCYHAPVFPRGGRRIKIRRMTHLSREKTKKIAPLTFGRCSLKWGRGARVHDQ